MVERAQGRGVERAVVGARGESLVADHLTALGYTIVARNVRMGRLEIDIIASKGDLVAFCEVRTRSHDRMMDPLATLDRNKAMRVRRAAAAWLAAGKVRAAQLRFDAASVVLGDADAEPRVSYYEHAF